MKINLRSITVMLGLLAIVSIMVPTQMQTQTFASTEPGTLDIEEAGDEDNNAEMLKMTIKEGNSKSQKVDDFQLTPDNAIFVEVGKNVQVTDDESFFRAVLTDTKDNDKQVKISQQGVVDLRGVKQGVYTLDVVIQDGNRKIAYEVMLFIGPDNDQNRQTVNKEVERVNKDVTINKKIVNIDKRVICGEDQKYDERTKKCISDKPPITPPTPTKTPTPPVVPTKPETPTLPAGQPPTTGTEDGKAPPSCTTADGKPGGISLSEGSLKCIPFDAVGAGTGGETTPIPDPGTEPTSGAGTPSGNAFPAGTRLVRMPDGGLLVAPPNAQAIYLKPTAAGMFMPSQNPDGSINIASPIGLPVKPGSITTGPEGVDLSQGRPVSVETLPKATTTGSAPSPSPGTEPTEPGGTGAGVAGRTAVGGTTPDTTTPPAGGTAVRPPETQPEEIPPTPTPTPTDQPTAPTDTPTTDTATDTDTGSEEDDMLFGPPETDTGTDTATDTPPTTETEPTTPPTDTTALDQGLVPLTPPLTPPTETGIPIPECDPETEVLVNNECVAAQEPEEGLLPPTPTEDLGAAETLPELQEDFATEETETGTDTGDVEESEPEESEESVESEDSGESSDEAE